MASIHPAFEAHQRGRFMRPDAHRWLNPAQQKRDAHGNWKSAAWVLQEDSRLDAFSRRADIESLLTELRHYTDMKAEIANWREVATVRKYSPMQPRTPAGSTDGGRWTSDGGGSTYLATPATAKPEVTHDSTGQQPWKSFATETWPDGSVARHTIFNRDGSIVRAEFAQVGADPGWDSRYAVQTPDGSITTFLNAGSEQTIIDSSGQIASQTIWTANGPEPQAIVQPAFLGPGVAAGAITVEAALALYTWLSTKNSSGEQATVAFVARDYPFSKAESLKLEQVGLLSRDKVEAACPRLIEVQERTDLAAQMVKSIGDYTTAAEYGTAVHKSLSDQIKSLDDPDFKAEKSYIKGKQENYGTKNSIRVDVLENVGNGTVCVYDIKTGKSGLGPARSMEIVTNVQTVFPGTSRIIVTEVRPRK